MHPSRCERIDPRSIVVNPGSSVGSRVIPVVVVVNPAVVNLKPDYPGFFVHVLVNGIDVYHSADVHVVEFWIVGFDSRNPLIEIPVVIPHETVLDLVVNSTVSKDNFLQRVDPQHPFHVI